MSSRNLSALIALLFCVATSSNAQLNGTYTVGAGGSFATLAAAATALTSGGVTGPVTFVVGGAEAGPITIGAYPGQGAANPVLISGGGTASLTGTGTVLTINGQYVTLDGFSGSFVSGAAIVIAGSFTTIRNCNFTMTVTSSTSANKVFALNGGTGVTIEDTTFGGGYEAFNSAAAVAQLTIQRCRILGGGFWTAQAAGNTVTIRNNFIYGNSNYGLRATDPAPNLRILNNSFYMVHPTASSQYCALRWYNTAANYSEVINNAFTDLHPNSTVGFVMWCSGALKPSVMDYNVYNGNGLALIFSTSNQTLASWQALGYDLNSVLGDPGYANTASSPPDLHITPTSPCFLSGQPNANVLDDIDGQVRNPGVPCRGADELAGTGLFASFSASPTSGAAALTVNFTDLTFTSDPGGVTSWAWDFQNDGIVDSTVQNPSFTYLVPGTYSVTLTTTDASHPAATLTRSNYIVVNPYQLVVTTSGSGVGDLQILPVPPQYQNPTAATGYLFISFATTSPVGTGPAFGIVPDPTVFSIAASPANVGDLLHWVVQPGFFPTVPFGVPAGALSFLAGVSVDFVQVDLGPTQNLLAWSNVRRVTF